MILTVSSIMIWSRNFSHLADVRVKPQMAEIEWAIWGHSCPLTCAATFFLGFFFVFLCGKLENFQWKLNTDVLYWGIIEFQLNSLRKERHLNRTKCGLLQITTEMRIHAQNTNKMLLTSSFMRKYICKGILHINNYLQGELCNDTHEFKKYKIWNW